MGRNFHQPLLHYMTHLSCIAPSCPTDTLVISMPKSQIARTFWVGVFDFPIYLTWSSGDRDAKICVPSSAPMQSLKCGYAPLSSLILLWTVGKLGFLGRMKYFVIFIKEVKTSSTFLLMVLPKCLKGVWPILFNSLSPHKNRKIATPWYLGNLHHLLANVGILKWKFLRTPLHFMYLKKWSLSLLLIRWGSHKWIEG